MMVAQTEMQSEATKMAVCFMQNPVEVPHQAPLSSNEDDAHHHKKDGLNPHKDEPQIYVFEADACSQPDRDKDTERNNKEQRHPNHKKNAR